MGNLDGIVHSAAFAPREELSGKYLDNVTRNGFSLGTRHKFIQSHSAL
jgi:enoyl-[acyl-carrier-protein] reductase (NADH)